MPCQIWQISGEHVRVCVRSWWTQFRVLLKRALLGQLRNPTDASCRLLMSCWVGTLAG